MKKTLIFLFILSFFISTYSVLAQDSNLPSPGILPDSPFYFLKVWKETIQNFFTFGIENKAKQFLHLADVRLVEYQKLVEKGKIEIAQKTLDKYEKQLNSAIEKIDELKYQNKDVKNVSQKLEDVVSKHLDVLSQNLQKVPDSGKQGIENAIEKTSQVLEQVKKIKSEACTEEAKVCPDGTTVGRTGPNCEFTPCPFQDNTLNHCKQEQQKEIAEHQINLGGGGTLIVQYIGTKDAITNLMKSYNLEITTYWDSISTLLIKVPPGTEIEWFCKLKQNPIIKNINYNSLDKPTGTPSETNN